MSKAQTIIPLYRLIRRSFKANGYTDWDPVSGAPLIGYTIVVAADPGAVVQLYASGDCSLNGADFEQSKIVPASGEIQFDIVVPDAMYDYLSIDATLDSLTSDCLTDISFP